MDAISFSLEPISDPGFIEDVWRSLHIATSHSIFLTWSWIEPWLRTLPGSISPQLLIARRSGQVVATAILIRKMNAQFGALAPRRAFFNATGEESLDSIVIEHNGFATNEIETQQLWSEFLDWLSKQGFDELIIPGLASPISANNFIVDQEVKLAYRRNDLPDLGSDGVLPKLSRNTRQQLVHAIRALNKIGDLQLSVATTPQEALGYFLSMKELHIRSWTKRNKRHAFYQPYFEIFHRRMIEDHTQDGSAQMLCVSAGDRVIGYLYNFLYRGVVFAYQSGFNVELDALKPGYVCHTLAIDHYAKIGATVYDFLAGTNQLKQSLSNETYPLYWIRIGRANLSNRAKSSARSWIRSTFRIPR